MDKNEINEEMLSILFEKAPDAIYLNDLKGTFIDGNEEAERITGYKREELIGKSFLDLNLLAFKDLSKAAANLGRNLNGQPTGPDEFILNKKDGGQIPVEIRTIPFTLNGKKMVMGIARDISVRKKVELKLEKAQMDYKKLIDQASDSVVVTRKGKVLYANGALARLVGFDRAEEVIGLSLNSFYHPDYSNQINEYTQARRRGEQAPSRYQIKIVNRAGEPIDVDVQVTLVEWEGTTAALTILRDITVQKQAQNELKLSEEKYRSFLESSRDGVTVNIQGKFVYVNPSFIEMVGYTEKELINSSILNTIAPEYIELVKDRSTRRQQGENVPAQYEIELVKKDGARIPIEFNVSRIEYEGKPASLTFIRDISERIQVELELEKTQYRYQTLIEQASDAIIVTSETEILYANKALALLLGYEQAENLIGLSPDPFYHPDHHEQLERYSRARRNGEYAPPRYQMKINTKTGETVEIEIQVTLIEWQGIIASLGILRDITQQKLFENRRVAVYQLAALLSQATTVAEISEKALDIINEIMDYEIVTFQTLDKDELWVQGTRGVDHYDKPIHIKDKSITAKAVRLQTTLNVPDVREDPDYFPGTSDNTLSELSVPIISGDVVRGVLNIESRQLNTFTREDEVLIELLSQHIASALERVHRTTEKEAYERELFEGKIRLEHERELNQLKTRFMSTATHEIRTPLASIQGYTEIIQEGISNLSDVQRQYFNVILRNVNRLSVLTDDLLDLQRFEEGRITVNLEKVNLKELSEDVMNEFTPILNEKNQIIQCNCPDISVEIDRLRMMQVVVNLLSNASKFSPVGTSIILDVEIIGEWVQFSVSDSGVGISEEDIPKLFAPFPDILVEGNVRGTGLGLTISKGIVELHGGQIWVESEGKGKGTTFKFTLPLKL